jgi:S-adenosyl-L-methionine methyltransferase
VKGLQMSRLDTNIRRLIAQRDILNHVARDLTLPRSGAILEVGLGNGRTYSHLLELFPDRRIIVFDRAFAAHRTLIPAAEDLVLGEIAVTALAFVGQDAALVHTDIGTGYADKDAVIRTWLPGLTASLLGPGGIAVSGLGLDHASLEPLPLPAGIDSDRYFLYRKRA